RRVLFRSHRTMTQEAAPAAIQAPFDGRPVEALGVRSVPWHRGDEYYIDTLDPRTNTIVSNRIVRVTGSRRMQQFETRIDDRYVRLPIAWSIDERRWLHLSEAFFHATHSEDPTIVNPGRIEKIRSVQACGHCHGQRLPADRDRIREILGNGDPYTAGEDLSKYFTPVDRGATIGSFSFATRFWSDG